MNYLLKDQETERLYFRKVTNADFDSWLPLFKEEHVATFLGIPIELSQREQCEFWFNKVSHRYKNNLGGMNALIDKTSKQLIGQAGLLVQNVENEERLEIGYSILPQYWNKGFASEAAIKCKNYCFENNLSQNLISMMHVDNKASEIVALKNGMSLEKQVDEFLVYSIDRKEWLNQN